MTKEEATEILNVIYARFMRLEFSYDFMTCILGSPMIEHDYPNMSWCMKVSFATDAYTTIDGLLHSGKYSFATLAKDNNQIENELNETMKRMEKIVPNMRTVRNQMFCHLVQKQTDDPIYLMYMEFRYLWDCLKDLHIYCRNIYDVQDSDMNAYGVDAFRALNREKDELRKLLMMGFISSFDEVLGDVANGKSLKDVKEVRSKRIVDE